MTILDVVVKDIEVKRNTEATLSCTVTMITTAMEISWSWSGKDLNDPNYESKSDGVIESSQTGTLTVKPGVITAAQTFTCIVSSLQNPTSVKKKFDVKLLVYGK